MRSAGIKPGVGALVVEKLWISLWKSLWESCGKIWRKLWENVFYTYFGEKVGVLHWVVEKFYKLICTRFNREKSGVLHIFHIAYYYYY